MDTSSGDDVDSTTDYASVEVTPPSEAARRRSSAMEPSGRGRSGNNSRQERRPTPREGVDQDSSAGPSSSGGRGHSSAEEHDTNGSALPQLAPRYLDTSVRLDARQRMSKQRRDAAAVRDRLQRMFRELDRLDREEKQRARARSDAEHAQLPARVSQKAYDRHRTALEQHRVAVAYRPVAYVGPASPSPVHALIHGGRPAPSNQTGSVHGRPPRARTSLQ